MRIASVFKRKKKNYSDIRQQLDEIQADKQKRINQKRSEHKIKPYGMPSGKVLKQMTISPVGITFDCEKGNFSRQDILINLEEGDIVTVEKYKYKGKDAYMLIGGRHNKDFGVINAGLASDIARDYPGKKIEGYISKTDRFYAEDKEENIYTCKVKLYIVES